MCGAIRKESGKLPRLSRNGRYGASFVSAATCGESTFWADRASKCFLEDCALHLPDASANRADRPRHLPDLRHGTRAHGCFRGSGSRSRIRLHAPALLDQRCVVVAAFAPVHVWRSARRASRTNCEEWNRIPSCHACSALGRLAFFSTLLGIACKSQSQYVHAHRLGHRRGLFEQHLRDFSPRSISSFLPGHARRRSSLFEAAAVITTLVLLGQ